MKRLAFGLALSGLIAGAYLVGRFQGQRHGSPAAARENRRILYYVDPMNPAHTSPEPGLAPCGMKMEPVYADGSSGTDAGRALASLPPGSVKLSSEKQQLIGVRTGVVEKKPLRCTQRLLGRVAVDETRVYQINATVDGWITQTLPYATGDYVQQHTVLAAFYSPEFLSAANALLFALNSKDRVQAGGLTNAADSSRVTQFNLNLQQYQDALKNLGMGDPQIQEMMETRQFRQNVDIIAPANGFILAREVSDGLRFEQGTELYRIADLSRVWILADVFENEAEIVQPGRQIHVSWPQQQRTFIATVSRALPQFDRGSRTLKVRLEVENPDHALKPDMFVDLELPIEVPEGVFVPADAVLQAGQRSGVFVDRGSGFFEPRGVKTGRRFGDQIEITDGLAPGETIALSGTFLLDSESRMKLAAAGLPGLRVTDPVCGMRVSEREAREGHRFSEREGKTYYFCSDGCKRNVDGNPAWILTEITPAHAGKAPVASPANPTTP